MLNSFTNKYSSRKAAPVAYLRPDHGKTSGLSKQVDRTAYQTNSSAGYSKDLCERILSCYKSGAASDTRNNWMSRLTQDALSFIANQRGLLLKAIEQEAQRYQAAKNLLEQIFDLLQIYSFDFNTSAIWTSLQVTCTRPAFVTEVLRYNKLREPVETVTTFRARLSTRFLSLVIVGRKDRLEFRMLPVEEVIGLTRAEAAYEPFLVIHCQEEDGEYNWKVGSHDLTPSAIETLSMEMFTMLVDQTKVEAARNHAF